MPFVQAYAATNVTITLRATTGSAELRGANDPRAGLHSVLAGTA